MTIANPPPTAYSLNEAEADLAYAHFNDQILALTLPVQDRETHWVSPLGGHQPTLVQALNAIYPQHAYESTFGWEIIFVNNGKNI